MKNSTSIKRSFIIIKKIEEGQFPSINKLCTHLSNNGYEFSERTIYRTLKELKNDYNLDINFNKLKNGYEINTEDDENAKLLLKFVDFVNTTSTIAENILEYKENLNCISFDNREEIKGVEMLKPILKAIINNNIIKIHHQGFTKENPSTYIIEPYLLKEYNRRWYIVGIKKITNELRIFGIDRIIKLEVTKDNFLPDKNINPTENFKNIVGIIFPNNKLENVILSFTPEQGQYIKTLPIHSSQKIIIDNNKELRIEMKLHPNIELFNQILKLGSRVKVIEPQYLAKQIKEEYQNALKRYK